MDSHSGKDKEGHFGGQIGQTQPGLCAVMETRDVFPSIIIDVLFLIPLISDGFSGRCKYAQDGYKK